MRFFWNTTAEFGTGSNNWELDSSSSDVRAESFVSDLQKHVIDMSQLEFHQVISDESQVLMDASLSAFSLHSEKVVLGGDLSANQVFMIGVYLVYEFITDLGRLE